MKLIHKIKRFFGFDIPYSVILMDAKTRLARTYVFDLAYNNEFICHSIKANEKQTKFLREWIHELMGGAETFTIWLHNQNISHYSVSRQYHTRYEAYVMKVQQTRHEWLDWMIEEWKSKEAKERLMKASGISVYCNTSGR